MTTPKTPSARPPATVAKAPKLGATDRVTLYLALVPYLLENSPVSVADAAARFRISPAEMRDLVGKLSNLGIPGAEGYYLPNDLFEINFDLFDERDIIDLVNAVGVDSTPRLSGTEAATLVAGLQFISGVVARDERGSVTALIEKIGLGASAHPSNIFVDTPEPPASITTLRSAFSQDKQVSFNYRNTRGESENRSVSPLRLDLVGDTWYLRAWCHLRDALRTFRLDRMDNVLITAIAITNSHKNVSLPDALFDARDTDVQVVVRLAESALPLIAEYRPRVHSAAADGHVLATIHFAHLTNVAKLVTRYPGILRVIEPPEAIATVVQYADEAMKQYTQP
jgi:proteasome accessory factor C